MNFEEAFEPSFWIRLGITVFAGLIIGLERQFRGKAAGIRTCILVCLGAMAFTRIGVMLQTPTSDPTRVIGQVVTGIGFLGAGMILSRRGQIQGVTSAAVMWVLSAIGCVIGTDHHGMAIVLSLVAVGTLMGVEVLETGFQALRRGVHANQDNKE